MTWPGGVVAGSLLGAASLTVPGTLAREVVWLVVAAGACAAIPAGVRRHRPRSTRPWWVVGAGLALLVAAHLLRFPLWATPGLALAADLATLLAYAAIGVAVIGLVRVQAPGDREGAIDATIVMIALATVLAGTVFTPDGGVAGISDVMLVVGPLVLSGVTAATLRLLFVGSIRVPSAWLLVGAGAAALTGNALRAVLSAQGTYARGSGADAWLIGAYVCVAAAALHPSMAHLTEPAQAGERRLAHTRLVFLGVSLLAAPAALFLQNGAGARRLPVLTSVLLSLLVLWRLGRLVSEREAVRQELHARAARQEALARIGLHALDDDEPAALFAEATGISAELLGLDTCVVVPGRSTEVGAPGAVALRVGGLGHEHGALVVSRAEEWNDEDLAFLQSVANVLAGAVDRHEAQSAMRHQALHDPLTGLPNRTLLRDRLGHALARTDRSGRVAVLFVDLDGFKRVNDDLGHQAGDELLVAVARRLEAVIRPHDTLARLAGDEFVIVCEDVQCGAGIDLAGRAAAVLSAPFALATGEVSVSASIGIAGTEEIPRAGVPKGDLGEEVDRLLSHADAAMYRAKHDGGGTFEVFDMASCTPADRRNQLEEGLRGAASRAELRLVYQPLVALGMDGDEVVGAEVFLRWDHPVEGAVPPGEFLPVAEGSGLILTIGEWVLREACAELAAWRAELPPDAPFTLFVNVSARELADPSLVGRVARVLSDAGVDPRHLCLDVTERAALGDGGAHAIAGLHELGVRVALDDFGAGSASLTNLVTMAPDVVKFDRAFTVRAGGSARERAVIGGVAAIAHQLGLTVIAEGVETAAHLDAVRDLGCDLAQGYHLGAPVPGERLRPRRTPSPPAGALPAALADARSRAALMTE